MPPILTNAIDFFASDAFGTLKIVVLGYFGLLWLSIIIWVTRDALQRSSSLLFQTFSILLNIAIPIIGVLLYLIIRPSKTRMEQYYEELERNMLEGTDSGEKNTCNKCLTSVDKDYSYCPNCGDSLKKTCLKCKKSFPNFWNICPFCGNEYKDNKKIKPLSKITD